MIGAAELWGRSQPAQSPTTLSTMPPTRLATERIRNPNDALRPHRSITVFIFCIALFSTVRGAPLRETPSDEQLPLSLQEGFYPYSVGNATAAKELARQAFYRLDGVEVPMEPDATSVILYPEKPIRKNPAKPRKPGGKKKPPFNSRKEALLTLHMDASKLKHNQTCEEERFKQRVKVPGCLTKTIVNKFCHGTCTSIYIPRMHRKLKAYFQSCAVCAPKEYDMVDVTLDCPGQDPPQITKTIVKDAMLQDSAYRRESIQLTRNQPTALPRM